MKIIDHRQSRKFAWVTNTHIIYKQASAYDKVVVTYPCLGEKITHMKDWINYITKSLHDDDRKQTYEDRQSSSK